MARQLQGSQRDFSYGEIDPDLKRADEHPARKGGLRQMANVRIHNSGALANRSGRGALYPVIDNGLRTERFTISPGNVHDIQFAPHRVKIIDSAGVTVANFTLQGNGAALEWDAGNLNIIVYAIFNLSIYLTFGGMRPQVITWDGASTWSIADYAEAISASGQKRTPFYRLSPQNVTMLPSAISGAITVQFSAPIVQNGMVGTRIRWAGRQLLLGSVIDGFKMNATVIEPLPPAQILTLSSAVGNFTIGDVVIGELSGAHGIVESTPTTQQLALLAFGPGPAIGDTVTGGTSGAVGIFVGVNGLDLVVSLNSATAFVLLETISGTWGSLNLAGVSPITLTVQLLQNTPTSATSFAATETIAGPSGSAKTSAVATTTPWPIAVWDDELINAYRGYPASCFTDQFRLGFCNFDALPGAIAWSAINAPTDLYVGANPDDAMLEIAPSKVQVFYVIPGPESSEFIFCDRRIYYIPISPTNPLKPGSIQFLLLSGDGCARVQPRISQEAILYVNAGQNSVMAVIATGAYNRPFNSKNLSDYHAHLFNNIQCIAAPSADNTLFNERYGYVLNGDGSIVSGKYSAESLPGNNPVIGWGPWSGAGQVRWIAAHAADVLFTSYYFGAGVVEILDDAHYLDCAIAVNALPAAFTPPFGKGPLWFIAGQSVTLIDQITRVMGTYQIDGNGFIIPQFIGGEDLASASLVAGQPWIMTAEPFCPAASPGSDVGQRMDLRYVARFAVHVLDSTGFVMAKLFSARETASSPALGSVVNVRRVPTWNVDDDATTPPKLRETVESWRPSGGSYDPRVAIIKDVPGPLTIEEIGFEVTL